MSGLARMSRYDSKVIALSGLIVALSVTCMFFTGLFPFATFALPALAGILLMTLSVEFGLKIALTAFAGVALLSLLIAPDKEAALLFTAFFGYYPLIKGRIEALKKRPVEWIVKFTVFNGSIILLYVILLYLFPMPELAEEFASYSSWMIAGLLALGNVTFLIYDIACTRVVTTYIRVLRPKLLKRY